ncbi:MAG: hypothetical protein M0Q91_10165, partial [Methanoregula sp.]|nr:hypothetical protein [Methanoregula sp.]
RRWKTRSSPGRSAARPGKTKKAKWAISSSSRTGYTGSCTSTPVCCIRSGTRTTMLRGLLIPEIFRSSG